MPLVALARRSVWGSISAMDIVTLAMVIALSIWSKRLARRHGAPSYLRWMPFVLGACWAIELACFFLTMRGILVASGRVGSVSPAYKAERMAAGISEAMNATAFGLVVMLVPIVATAVLLFVWSRRLAPAPSR